MLFSHGTTIEMMGTISQGALEGTWFICLKKCQQWMQQKTIPLRIIGHLKD